MRRAASARLSSPPAGSPSVSESGEGPSTEPSGEEAADSADKLASEETADPPGKAGKGGRPRDRQEGGREGGKANLAYRLSQECQGGHAIHQRGHWPRGREDEVKARGIPEGASNEFKRATHSGGHSKVSGKVVGLQVSTGSGRPTVATGVLRSRLDTGRAGKAVRPGVLAKSGLISWASSGTWLVMVSASSSSKISNPSQVKLKKIENFKFV